MEKQRLTSTDIQNEPNDKVRCYTRVSVVLDNFSDAASFAEYMEMCAQTYFEEETTTSE